MRRSASSGLFGNPVLVGAVTVLVITVAVFLSYNANKGLPFVPTKQLNLQVPNGANLLPGNEVREGGFRIGIVSDMKAIPLPNGEVGAQVELKLDKKSSDVPEDSVFAIRPRSVLGLKYVELQRGKSEKILEDGDTLPFDRAHIPVELDQFYNIFDEETRTGARKNLRGFGDAFALRGASLNRTIDEAPRFLAHLEPVMRVLSSDETNLEDFFKELGDFTRILAPVADRYAHGFEAGADTFEAWSRYPDRLGLTIEKSVPTLDASIKSLKVQRPFLTELAAFSTELENVADELPRALPGIIPALETGIPVLKRSPEINTKLAETLDALRDLMASPNTGRSLRGLTATVATLNPAVRFLGPYITVCNYFNYSWTHVAEHLTEINPTGGAQRTLLNQAGQQVDPSGQRTGVSTLGAITPANGGATNSTPQFLHTNNYTAAVDNQGNADCESGQRGYMQKQATYIPDPNVKIVVDPHIPGNSGTTYTGRPKVPAGQTFDRAPKIGPRMPKELDPTNPELGR
jgi:ABC-type transporter Mla subunit MlaD